MTVPNLVDLVLPPGGPPAPAPLPAASAIRQACAPLGELPGQLRLPRLSPAERAQLAGLVRTDLMELSLAHRALLAEDPALAAEAGVAPAFLQHVIDLDLALSSLQRAAETAAEATLDLELRALAALSRACTAVERHVEAALTRPAATAEEVVARDLLSIHFHPARQLRQRRARSQSLRRGRQERRLRPLARRLDGAARTREELRAIDALVAAARAEAPSASRPRKKETPDA